MTRAQALALAAGAGIALSPPALAAGDEVATGPVTTLRGVVEAVKQCWQPPRGLAGLERVEQTVRFSLRRDGSFAGDPRITFSNLPADGRARDLLRQSTIDAFRRCSPLDISPGLGQAVAGRPFTVRFIYKGPQGQGV